VGSAIMIGYKFGFGISKNRINEILLKVILVNIHLNSLSFCFFLPINSNILNKLTEFIQA